VSCSSAVLPPWTTSRLTASRMFTATCHRQLCRSPYRPHFATLVSHLQLLAKITYRRNTHRELSCKCSIGEWILDWEIVAIVLLGGAAMGGLAYLLGEYRSLRDRDWT
jgi:hypothetical protein